MNGYSRLACFYRLAETHHQPAQLSSITLRPISTAGAAPSTPAPLKLQPKSASYDAERAAKAGNLVSIFKEWTSSLPGNGSLILSHGSLLSIPHGEFIQSYAVVFPAKSLPVPKSAPQDETRNHPEPEAYGVLNAQQLVQLKVEIGENQSVRYVYKK
jgi:peroxin-1